MIPVALVSSGEYTDLPATTNPYSTSGTGRIVAFPNWVQHRVPSISNAASTGSSATRKIVSLYTSWS
jgi:hypothetical protein